MKTQYVFVLLAAMLLSPAFLGASSCGTLVPQKIQRQADWAALNDPAWELRWKDSPRDQNPRVLYDSRIEMDVTSRATAWFNLRGQTAALALATPDIYVLGFAQNPFKTESDTWVIQEIARQGGATARQKLGITFNPATVPLTFQEAVSVQTNIGIAMTGARFLARTPQGDGYITVLRETHQNDVLVILTIAQSAAASRAADSAALLLRHPSTEPVFTAVTWENLAEKWAQYYNVDTRLVKAVIDAEGAQNIAGDYDTNQVPHAFGYGQVWPRWHSASVQRAVLDVTGTSTNITDEQTLGKIILANNDISMATAVLAIRDTWVGIGSPANFTNYSIYESFTKKYVGPAVSQQDIQRRWQIWQKYFP